MSLYNQSIGEFLKAALQPPGLDNTPQTLCDILHGLPRVLTVRKIKKVVEAVIAADLTCLDYRHSIIGLIHADYSTGFGWGDVPSELVGSVSNCTAEYYNAVLHGVYTMLVEFIMVILVPDMTACELHCVWRVTVLLTFDMCPDSRKKTRYDQMQKSYADFETDDDNDNIEKDSKLLALFKAALPLPPPLPLPIERNCILDAACKCLVIASFAPPA